MVYARRICSVVLAVLMLTAAPLVLSAASEVPLGVEMVVNGGFESVSGTTPDNWSGVYTWGNGSVLSLVSAADNPANVHSGSYAIKYDVKGGDNPFLSQGIDGVWARCKYRVSFWYKAVIPSGGMSVKFEYGGAPAVSEYYTTSFGAASDWTYAEHDFYVTEGANFARIMPRAYADGTVMYIDDVSLKLIDTPDQFDMETDWVFYYENYDEATATLTMDTFYNQEDYVVDFKITRGLQTLSESKGNTFKDYKIECKLDITKLAKKSEYILQAVVKDADGKTVETLKEYIYRIDRPTNIREDGAYVVDGKIFEPIIAYHFDLNDYEDALKAGVNVFQWGSPSLDAEKCLADLDDFHAKG